MQHQRTNRTAARLLATLMAGALLMLASTGFSAPKDYAVVIGVDKVAGLDAQISGAQNDAQSFAAELERKGIKPILLLNEQATRSAIASAISAGARSEHLIVYFAGLGSGPSAPRIITAEDSKGLELQALDKQLLSAKAKSTTVILDTSFAGLRDSKDGPSLFTSRFYQPPAVTSSRALSAIGANASDLPGLSHKQICYITAGRFNENTFEDSFDGTVHGVFTSYLCQRLENSQGPIAWSTIQWDVAAQVAAHVEDLQHPNFPQQYLANAALDGNSIAPPEYGAAKATPINTFPAVPGGPPHSLTPQHRTLWTLFNVDNIDPKLVSLQMKPNKAAVMVKEPLEFSLSVGKDGYLVVVEHSVEGTLMPIFPRDGNILSAQVRAGQTVIVPEPGITAYADRDGKERLKAFLFDDRDAAAALLAGLDSHGTDIGATFGSVSQRLQSRGIVFTRSLSKAEFGEHKKISGVPITADLTFRVIGK